MRKKSQLHWSVRAVFDRAEERGLKTGGWVKLSQLLAERFGIAIASGTLRYWAEGYSEPKVSELDAMAMAVGFVMELDNEDEG